jgi:hypothetical protein
MYNKAFYVRYPVMYEYMSVLLFWVLTPSELVVVSVLLFRSAPECEASTVCNSCVALHQAPRHEDVWLSGDTSWRRGVS